ncbi:MAG: pyridoxamine 5'-phosphate oxidase family protein [Candidatus Aenigmarchaeota archaeon]|nr:pyridoxamine 5'-phosphate oxidase family protein [Candidatus Aenigmarchaeota archaeon]
MGAFRIPFLGAKGQMRLIESNFLCRIAFGGSEFPYIAPFFYVLEKGRIYVIASNYGLKLALMESRPKVCLEIESNSGDFSSFFFVRLLGTISIVKDATEEKAVRMRFFKLFSSGKVSERALTAIGLLETDPPEAILETSQNLVWRLDVSESRALGFGELP